MISGNTPLHVACERGLVGQIEMLTCKLDKEEDPGLQACELPQDVDVKNYSGKLRKISVIFLALLFLNRELKLGVLSEYIFLESSLLHRILFVTNILLCLCYFMISSYKKIKFPRTKSI